MAFKPGQSGNLAGRPKGVKDKRTVFRDMVEPSSAQLISKAVDMALGGNEAMLRLLLDRILPAKSREHVVNIDMTSDRLVDKARKISIALFQGTISVSVAKTLMDTLATEVKILEYDVLEKRLSEVEQAMKYGVSSDDWIEE